MKKQFRDFKSAREFVRALNLKVVKEWLEYCKSGNKPDDIPRNSNTTYKKEWISWGDFLGTGTIGNSDRQFRSFKEAREFVRILGLKGNPQWREYCASGKRPNNIPSLPDTVYKKEWISWGDFLGTGFIATKDRVYRPFTEAREFIQNLGLKSQKEWYEYCRSGNKPDDIPVNPRINYKKDFKGYGDWLGTGTIAAQDKLFRSFKEARYFVRALNLKSQKEWLEYCKSDNKPDDIPRNSNTTYKKEWISWGDFLGTGTIASKDMVFLPFKEAREFVRSLNLKGQNEWKEYCKSGNKPDDIPSAPWDVYKEWKKK